MKKKIIISGRPEEQDWKKNRELCMDVITYLLGDKRMKAGKNYVGTLRRDVECEDFNYEEHLTFVETADRRREKRNPHLFRGQYLNITCNENGTLRINFRPLNIERGFSTDSFVTGVANELMWALEGLVGN